MPFKPSPQQAAIYGWVTHGKGSALVRAVAGAGKTTTLVHAVGLMTGSVFFGAFNKEIKNEIERRCAARPGLTVSTMHAAGLAAWRNFIRSHPTVDSNKCRNIYREASAKYPQYAPFEGVVLELVSKVKQAGFGVLVNVNDKDAWLNIIDHYNLDTADEDELVIKLAKKVLKASYDTDVNVIDYDDMIYAPLVHDVKIPKYDWVLIDEAQDTNAVRRELALRMLKPEGRLIAVGDEHQAIYGFTGADADALDLIAQATNAVDLPLTITYRCPKAVVAVARQYVSHIEAAPTAPEGQVESLAYQTFMGKVRPGDAVLCRFNAPIIELAFALIAAGVPARVEGRDIGAGLKKLARRWKSPTFDALMTHLDEYEEREVKKHMDKEQEARAQSVTDTVNCLRVIIGRTITKDSTLTPVEQVCEEIDNIFGEKDSNTPVVLLSSIHKSKGREWPNVFWLQTGPSKWAKKQWEVDQEVNLCYVACTRAQSYLGLVEMPAKRTKEEA